MNIYTIGHSTHTNEEFLAMLHEAEIEVLVDIRAFPASRKFPQFNEANFRDCLSKDDIDYVHFSLLGERRNKSQLFQDELNDGWNNQSFHNYDDYTLTKDFQKGIDDLKQLATKKRMKRLFIRKYNVSPCFMRRSSSLPQPSVCQLAHSLAGTQPQSQHDYRWKCLDFFK